LIVPGVLALVGCLTLLCVGTNLYSERRRVLAESVAHQAIRLASTGASSDTISIDLVPAESDYFSTRKVEEFRHIGSDNILWSLSSYEVFFIDAAGEHFRADVYARGENWEVHFILAHSP
jgi:hypothetical protein